jgi:hypothetical protein
VNGFTSLFYAILTIGFFGAGLSYLVAPVPMLRAVFGGSVGAAGPESIVLWQLIGISLSTIVAPACLSLKVGWSPKVLGTPAVTFCPKRLETAALPTFCRGLGPA